MYNFEIILFIAVALFSILAFVREWFPIEVTALLTLGILLVTGLITETEAVSGFSNHAVITIGAMFVISKAISKTGVIESFTMFIEKLGKGKTWLVLLLFFLAVSFFSAFINNTATVALLIPVGMQLAINLKISPSKVMMPLSFAAIVGGTTTIIGTSTNLIVADLAKNSGIEISLFEMSKLGIIFVVITLIYNLFASKYLLSSRIPISGLTKKYHMSTYLTEVQVSDDSPLIGATLLQSGIGPKYDIIALEIIRDGRHINTNIRFEIIKENDILLIQSPVENLLNFRNEQNVLLLSDIKLNDNELNQNDNVLIEALLSTTSSLAGKSLKDIDFRKKYGVFVLAIKRQNAIIRKKIAYVFLKNFDSILIFGSRTRVEALKKDSDFILLDEIDVNLHKIKYWWFALGLIPVVVLLTLFNIVSIMEATLIGAILVILLGIVPIQEVYRSINWTVIFLVAAFIPMGAAMNHVGLDVTLSKSFIHLSEYFGQQGIVSIFFFITMLLTAFLSNNATAIIMTPIVMRTSALLGVSAVPLVMTIMFAASLSFITPNGYQTNAMVYSPGGYKYKDFIKAGLPLHIILWLIGSYLIPIFWPLY
jgi:di/tricarboxylate transporter